MLDEGPNLEGWIEEDTAGASRSWRNARGDVLSLNTEDTLPVRPHRADVVGLQHWARAIAEQKNAGLINVERHRGRLPRVTVIARNP